MTPTPPASALALAPRSARLTLALLYGATITLWAGAWMYAIANEPPARIGVEWDGGLGAPACCSPA